MTTILLFSVRGNVICLLKIMSHEEYITIVIMDILQYTSEK